MYKHILVATDGSRLSEKAIRTATQLAKTCDAKVTGVNVISPYEEPRFGDGTASGASFLPKSYKEHAEGKARKALEKVASAAQAAGVEWSTTFVAGKNPWKSIISLARSRKCDVIVMASQGRDSLESLLIGSETQKVLVHSKVPVLVCR